MPRDAAEAPRIDREKLGVIVTKKLVQRKNGAGPTGGPATAILSEGLIRFTPWLPPLS
jgi:hypothetical protein